MKIRRWQETQRAAVREAAAAFGVFLSVSLVFAFMHTHFLKNRNLAIEKNSRQLAGEARGVREMADSLAKIHRSARSKHRLLIFLNHLAEQVPGSIRLKEIQIEENSFVFRGESPSQVFLTQTVQVFEANREISEIKLEHTRLRKRLNREFFEFEVSGKWN